MVYQHLSGASPALPWCNTSPPPLLASFWWNDLKAAIKHQRPYLSGTMQPGINHSGTTLVQKAPAPFWYNAASRHKAKSQLLLVGPWERPTQMKMVMMSTTTMMEVVVNTIQKGLKYFLSVPKAAGSLFTPVICLRTKKPCMRCIFAFSCQHPRQSMCQSTDASALLNW